METTDSMALQQVIFDTEVNNSLPQNTFKHNLKAIFIV